MIMKREKTTNNRSEPKGKADIGIIRQGLFKIAVDNVKESRGKEAKMDENFNGKLKQFKKSNRYSIPEKYKKSEIKSLLNGFVSKPATIEVRFTEPEDRSGENIKLKTQRGKKN